MIADLRFAVRRLAKSPGFTAVVLVTLALGIGVNTGIFSAFKGIVLRPLAGVRDSRGLVAVMWTTRGGDQLPLSCVELRDFQQRTRTLGGLEATAVVPFSLDDHGRAVRIWGEFVTGGHHAMLGIKPFLGRMIQPEDDRFPGGAQVLVLSHRYWQGHFGGDPAVVGRVVRVNGLAFTVIGVAEPDFVGTTVGFALDLFVPAAAAEYLRPYGGNGADIFTKRDYRAFSPVGRLRPAVPFAQARSEIAAIGAALAREHPAECEGKSATLVSFLESPFGAQTYLRPIFGLMLGMTALVLLIMCANVANLLLARAGARTHEIAIRLAIGAGRIQVVRQLLTESLVLALLGGALGGWLASATPDLLRALWPANLRVPIRLNAEPDATVFVFTLLVSLASALAFGLLPALQSSRTSVLAALKSGPAHGAPARRWGRNLLVIAQVAVAIPLLVAAGLLLRSARRQKTADFGFDPRHLALLVFDLRPNGYDAASGGVFCERLLRDLRGLPGVEAASLANQLPVHVVPARQAEIEVAGYVRPPSEARQVLFNTVSPDYFRTLRIALVAGREFTAADRSETPGVAVINETMARRYWPGQDPLDRSFKLYGKAYRVVGVARDVKYLTPIESPRPYFYLSQSQSFSSELVVQVRTSGEPRSLLPVILDRIARLDPRLPVFGVETMDDYMDFALSLSSFAADGLLLAGSLGLLLTALGMFATVSYAVSMRTREIGLRMALGAQRADVVRLVVRQGLWLTGAGAVVGLAGAVASTRLLQSLLFETSPTDPVTFAAVLALVAGTTVLACWLPARKATRVDPNIALRAE